MNGCAYCIDLHSKDARAAGETEQRLYALDAWRETPFYTPRERAARAWTEALTFVSQGHVPDAVFQEVRAEFSEGELMNLTTVVVAINAWNRRAIAFRAVPGTYQPLAHKYAEPAAAPAGGLIARRDAHKVSLALRLWGLYACDGDATPLVPLLTERERRRRWRHLIFHITSWRATDEKDAAERGGNRRGDVRDDVRTTARPGHGAWARLFGGAHAVPHAVCRRQRGPQLQRRHGSGVV
jgi:hypothetical protein